MKYLVVNGDDFGRSSEVNAGIIRAHRDGILTSASLMVAGAASREAADRSAEFPALDVGLHLVLCNGASLLPPERLGDVVDACGRFRQGEVTAAFRYLLDRRVRAAIRDECRAQIECHLELIGRLNHVDGHHNLHLHPVLLDILIDLAAEYHVSWIRLLREPLFTTLRLARDRFAMKLVESIFFRALSARAQRRMTRLGVAGNDRLFGFHQSGRLSKRYISGIIAALPDGRVTEFYFHPADDLGRMPAPRPAQVRETEWLTSRELRVLIDAQLVKLTNFAELVPSVSAG